MKLIFFSPFSVIWQHAFPEASVAHSLQSLGYEIKYVGCNRLYSKMCSGMTIYNLNSRSSESERKKVCEICSGRKKVIGKYLNTGPLDIIDFISLSEKKSIDDKLESLSREQLLDLVEKNIAVGKISLYLVLLKYKKTTDLFTDEEWNEYFIELKHVLYTLLAFEKILKLEKPDAVFVYNSFYPVNRVVALITEKMGIKNYCLHAGWRLSNRLQTLSIGKGHHYDIFNNILSHWNVLYQNLPAQPSDIYKVRDHFLELMQGNNIFVYSSSNNIKLDIAKYFGISENQKIIAAVLSSNDERNGVETIGVVPRYENLIFENQTIWLKELIEYAKKNDNVFLIIRVHPREFPNRREGIMSEYAKSLQSLFSELPHNVKINYPSDDISMYQLAKFIDVCLHAGSSVGKEMALLGIPVVNYIPKGLTYPKDISLFAEDKMAYFKAIEDALEIGWSIDCAQKAFRWCAYEFSTILFDISDKCKLVESNKITSLMKRIFRKLILKLVPYYFERLDCWRANKPLRETSNIHTLLQTNMVSKVDLLSKNSGSEKRCDKVEIETIKKVYKEIISLLYTKDEKYGARITLREKMAKGLAV